MKITILVFAIFVAHLAYVQAANCPSVCSFFRPSATVCVQDKKAKICRKLKKCTVDEENCQRRTQGRPGLIITDTKRCQNIHSIGGQGRCAPINCRKIVCDQVNPQQGCYGSRKGKCKLDTYCNVVRENCRNVAKKQLFRLDDRNCRGMMRGQGLQKCRRW